MAATIPTPQRTISKTQARRFLLAYHSLLPARTLSGKLGALQFMQKVRCIQFDPVNVVGWNPDLVLQARVSDYTSKMLDELLYADRVLFDHFDKVQSIILSEDWPAFSRRREHYSNHVWFPAEQTVSLHPIILQKIQAEGAVSSLDLEKKAAIEGFWGVPIRVERAALENLYNMGRLGIHHRVGTRRYFDLIERLLPADVLERTDPNETIEQYQEWHIMRRIGAIGLAHASGAEVWQGILGVKGQERRAILRQLVEHGDLIDIAVDEIPRQVFYMRAVDAALLDQVTEQPLSEQRAALLAPLDNLLWDRDVIRWIFDFDYVWEVYKPAHKRSYGHYVLPVLCGDRFIARCEPVLDRKANQLVLRNWWWEADFKPEDEVMPVLSECLAAFRDYLEVKSVRFEQPVAVDRWMNSINGL